MKEGWEIKKLGELGSFQRGGNFLKSDFVEEGYPCIHYGQIHMRFGVATYKHLTCIPDSIASSKAKIAHKGDLIVAITSEDVEGSCKSTAWMGDYDIAIGAHAAIYHHRLDPLYVSYYFKSPQFNKQKEVYTHGFKVVEIRPVDIANITIPFPSLTEQNRIASLLTAAFERIEVLKVDAEKSLVSAKDLIQAVLREELKPKEGWTKYSLQDVCDEYGVYGMSSPSKAFDGIRYLRITDITDSGDLNDDKVSVDAETIEPKYMLRDGDLLFARTGATVGKALVYDSSFGKCCYAGYLIRYRPNQGIVLPRFLYYITHSSSYYEWVRASQRSATLPNISAKLYNALEIYLPSIKEQISIVSRLDALINISNSLNQNYQRTLMLCEDMKVSLLRKAFNGEL